MGIGDQIDPIRRTSQYTRRGIPIWVREEAACIAEFQRALFDGDIYDSVKPQIVEAFARSLFEMRVAHYTHAKTIGDACACEGLE